MTKEAALDIFIQLAESYRGTYAEHQKLQEAIKVLSELKEVTSDG